MFTCFIDIDGVIADFWRAAAHCHGRNYDALPLRSGDVADVFGLTPLQFWSPLSREFWANMPLMPDARELVLDLERLFGENNCALLTSPPLDNTAAAGKLDWVQRNFKRYHRKTFIGAEKWRLAHRHAVLIDDWWKQCSEFIGHGGFAIHVPRPWNERHAQASISRLTVINYATSIVEGRPWPQS